MAQKDKHFTQNATGVDLVEFFWVVIALVFKFLTDCTPGRKKPLVLKGIDTIF